MEQEQYVINNNGEKFMLVKVEDNKPQEPTKSNHFKERERDEKGRFISDGSKEKKMTPEEKHAYYRHDTLTFRSDRDRPHVYHRHHDPLLDINVWKKILAGGLLVILLLGALL
ncbi:hypothetical protein BpsS140_00042 [Bacillus phage vB_BpsS-140]|nr:hypothetical protein BpsS140_00042 [Bacillus phage vB_BpsS-140]